MKIELPENPNLYFVLLGVFFIVVDFILVFYTGEKDLINLLIIIIGCSFFVYGVYGLQKQEKQKSRKREAEIELLKAKTYKSNALAGRHAGHKFG